MRFAVTGEWTRNRLLMRIMGWLLAFMALLWITNGLLYFHAMDLTPGSVVAHYLGDEASFRPPRSYRSLLEVSHFHLFAMGIWLVTATHLLLFVPGPPRAKKILIDMAFLGALADESAGWLVRFVHPAFAWQKVLGFLALQGSLLAIMLLVAYAAWTRAPSAYTQGEAGG